ncbi:hypothetical protein PtA15_2A362 [Puccinia triticina]|nr:uncharacterized protein PtA15_2A362 [Puccinia triticina]WAQ82049.1 hypothetical protein PtA15_2A362 [Puccinia triticina]
MSSFFYPRHQQPSGYGQAPLFDFLDQHPSPFCPDPYDSYPRRPYSHSHHPHRESAGLFHPQELGYHDRYQAPNIHPLRHLRQQQLDRDALESHPHSLGYNSSHPLHQLRQHKLDRDALQNRFPYGHPCRRASLHHGPPNYTEQDSLRAERARRLAEAKMRQLGQSVPEEEMKVEVTLPDGRQCVVPISWAKKMQTKYPGILTNSMIRAHRTPSPAPAQLDQPLASESDHDSDFYVLDPTQDPSIPVLATSSPPPSAARRRTPSPQPPKHSPEEQDAAARLIQQQFRAHQSLKHLAELELTFDKLKSEFTYPALFDLKFVASPEQSDSPTPSSTKLAFNHPVNRSVQAFEEGLTQLQIKADAILSRGNPKVKSWRKRLIKAVEAQLDQLDRFKTEAWSAQHLAHLESATKNQTDDGCEDVEMTDEIMNTDVESVSSDRLSVDSAALAIPLPNEDVSQVPPESEETLVIPAPSEQANQSLETLVIPVATSAAHPPPPLSKSDASFAPARVVDPLVTSNGDLICPAPAASIGSDDILVSPV